MILRVLSRFFQMFYGNRDGTSLIQINFVDSILEKPPPPWQGGFSKICCANFGEVPEWLNGTVLKTVEYILRYRRRIHNDDENHRIYLMVCNGI